MRTLTRARRQGRMLSLLLAFFTGAVSSCSDQTAPTVVTPLEGVAVMRKVGPLQVGDTTRLEFALYGAGRNGSFSTPVPLIAGQHRITYGVGDTTIASVSADGRITARRIGRTLTWVTVDDTLGASDYLDVVRAPQQLVVLASGDGDVDVSTGATCNSRPYGPPAPGRYLGQSCLLATCRIRGGVLQQACVLDASNPFRIRTIYDFTVSILVDSLVTVQFRDGAGRNIPASTMMLFAGSARYVRREFVLQPDTVRLVVTARRAP